ncbi:uncharacterized protein LOC129217423 [Uloborus diversus]|uniref:uncharacterized protein LOC129217423 n=1 Tax=Uloborus diversus TaxID=327109 RepID=UPI0024099FF8|nr:uncharacterized protein LOC129217423 [Uloborus diversus]
MLVKVRHSNGVEAKVIDCVASDGTAENEQLLSDSNGCTVDAAIFPPLQEKTNSKTGIKMIHTTFPAFKFPERENLHLQCRVLICNSTCPLESCSKSRWSTRGRSRSTRTSSRNTILREMGVFNSVEVRTPHVEKKTHTTSAASVKEPATPRPDDMFCLNSARMVIIIGILLGVLLVSLVVTICTCVRARELRRRLAQRQTLPYGKVHEYS